MQLQLFSLGNAFDQYRTESDAKLLSLSNAFDQYRTDTDARIMQNEMMMKEHNQTIREMQTVIHQDSAKILLLEEDNLRLTTLLNEKTERTLEIEDDNKDDQEQDNITEEISFTDDNAYKKEYNKRDDDDHTDSGTGAEFSGMRTSAER